MTNLLTPIPNRAFDRINQMMEDLVGNDTFPSLWAPTAWTSTLWSPSVDISETEKEYTLKMDLPGFDQKDIEVELRGDVLSIAGKREQTTDEKKDGKLIRYERRFGSFSRSFVLDTPVAPDGITAKFDNGVLTVTATKSETAQSKKIPVG